MLKTTEVLFRNLRFALFGVFTPEFTRNQTDTLCLLTADGSFSTTIPMSLSSNTHKTKYMHVSRGLQWYLVLVLIL